MHIIKHMVCVLCLSFLLDRLLQYERVDEESSGRFFNTLLKYTGKNKIFLTSCTVFADSEATVSSESEGEGARERDREAGKK